MCDLCIERRPILETRRWIYILERQEELIFDHLAGQVKKMAIAQIASQKDVGVGPGPALPPPPPPFCSGIFFSFAIVCLMVLRSLVLKYIFFNKHC